MKINLTPTETQTIIHELEQGLYQESPTSYDIRLKRIINKLKEAK